MLTRGGIERWDVSHLVEAADHWKRTAITWTEQYEDLHRGSYTAGGYEWSGTAAEAMQDSTARHALLASNQAVELHGAASIADQGAADQHYARQSALSAISAAESQGYVVSEDLSVTDGITTMDPAEAAAREAEAHEHEATVRYHAAVLEAADEETATKLNGIQLVDYTTTAPQAPQAPPPNLPPPIPQPAPGPNPLPFATAGPPPPDPVNDFYRDLAKGSNQIAASEPCPVTPTPPPSAWEKLATPAPGVSESTLTDKWAMYLGAAGTFGATITTDPLVGVFAAALLKPTFDDLLEAYGVSAPWDGEG